MVTPKQTPKKKKDIVTKRTITGTGQDITGLSQADRVKAIEASGFVPSEKAPPTAPGTREAIQGSVAVTPSGNTVVGPGVRPQEIVNKGGQAITPLTPEQNQQEQNEMTAEILGPEPIPKARELESTNVGAFQDVDLNSYKTIELIGNNPLGQAIIGKISFDQLKEADNLDEVLKLTDYMRDNGLTPKQVSNDPYIQSLLKLELNKLDIELLKSGEVEVGALSQLVEGIPFVNQGARKFGGSAIIPTVPSQRIDDLDQKITVMGNTIRDYRMAAARNPTRADQYLDMIDRSEREIRNAESRIKLLIIQSPILQNSPEEVEVIQENINRNLNRIGDAKLAIQTGETLEMAMASSAANIQ